jgi:hypothetical protein
MSSPQAVATTKQANGSSFTVANPRQSAIQPVLPDRNVTADTIEDAYVCFIFYCNPALPSDADTNSLREAFANPPKSGGKSFSPFVIYELVQRFYRKEIKTWTELTTRLGVEPPDLSKDESVQKVAQYGVRLKVCAIQGVCVCTLSRCAISTPATSPRPMILRTPHSLTFRRNG